jgi:hypothetical protein
MKMAGHVACMGREEVHRRRWEDYITMDFKKSFGRAWTGLIWLRIVKNVRLL